MLHIIVCMLLNCWDDRCWHHQAIIIMLACWLGRIGNWDAVEDFQFAFGGGATENDKF